MKSEPLKKEDVIDDGEYLIPVSKLKSAVEWFWKEFKFEFNELSKNYQTIYQFRRKITKIKNEAFQDVIKEWGEDERKNKKIL